MADQTSTWALRLEDQTSGAAESAAQALENLGKQIKADSREISEMQRALKNLERATTPNIAQTEALTKRISAQKDAVARAQSQYIALGGSFKSAASSGESFTARMKRMLEEQAKLKPSAGGDGVAQQLKNIAKAGPGASQQLKQLGELATGLPGPLGRLGGSITNVGKVLGLGGAGVGLVGALALAAAAMAGLGIAAVTLGYKLVKLSTIIGEAVRNERLHYDALVATTEALQRAGMSGQSMQEMISRVAKRVPTARTELAKMTDELVGIGLAGPELESALEALGLTFSLSGERAADAFKDQIREMAKAGKATDDLSQHVKTALGGPAAEAMLSLSVSALKFKESLDELFTGVQTDELRESFKDLLAFFDIALPSGRALKTLSTLIVQPMIDGLTSYFVALREHWERVLIKLQEIAIWVLRVRNWMRDFKMPSAGDLAKSFFGLGKNPPSPFASFPKFGETGEAKPGTGATLANPLGAWKPEFNVNVKVPQAAPPVVQEPVPYVPYVPAAKRTRGGGGGGGGGVAIGRGGASGAGGGVVIRGPQSEPPPQPAKPPINITIGDIIINAATTDPKQLAKDFRRELEAVLENLAIEIGAPMRVPQ